MILIADSGSTKTDWTLLDTEVLSTFHSPGINPVHQTTEQIRLTLPVTESRPEAVFFYGAGCTPEHIPAMTALLADYFRAPLVEVSSDLLGAARAVCGREEGIAAILGTGANSGLYNGERIVQNTPAMGYILGDEGSGAVLGRMFLNAIFKRPDMADVRDDFLQASCLTQADIIRRVYREPMANRFLASTSLYIGSHQEHPLLRQLVVDNFRSFFRNNVQPYQRHDLPVGVVGSMAYHYAGRLAEAARMEGYELGNVLKSPMEGLVAYHLAAQG